MRPRQRSDALVNRWGGPWVALAALLVLAAALRLVGIRYGLPFPLLNPDERNIVPRAWAMTHGGGLDPHWFDYPTLVMYMLAPFQAWQPEPSYLTARIVAGRGRARRESRPRGGWDARAYGPVAGFVAAAAVAVETTYVAYSRMAVTDVPLTRRRHGRARADGLGPDRARRARGRARGEREVPGDHPPRAARRGRVGAVETPRDRRRARGRRVRRHEPVRADRLPAGRPETRGASSAGRIPAGSASRTTTPRRSRSPAGSGTASGPRS